MRSIKICVLVLLGVFVVTGCATSSKDDAPAVKSIVTTTHSETEGAAAATLTDIRKQPVPERPDVTRVVLLLDKKSSYSTSREGNQLIINVLNAKMASSLKPLEVQDPIIKTITAKQVGNSVRSVIELVNQEIAYRPSSSAADPFQITLDIWQLALKTAVPQPPPAPGVSRPAEIVPAQAGERTQEITLNIQDQPVAGTSPAVTASEVTAPKDVPTQLQWFSEKLSQVIQEREHLKQQLLETEKTYAVKDSMVLVVDRKLQEANARVLELEEELIKIKSNASLAQENEKALHGQMAQILNRLEQSAGISSTTTANLSSQERAANLSQHIAMLYQESIVLGETHTEIEALKTQLASTTQERDTAKARLDAFTSEVNAMNSMSAKLAAIERELGVKDSEFSRLRQSINALVKLVGGTPIEPMTRMAAGTAQPAPPSATPQIMSQGTPGKQAGADSIELAQLIRQQSLSVGGADEYVLGPDDVIQIKVLKEENLDKTVTVSADGFITYPLLGDLRVEGLSTNQVDAQMTSLLARDFLVDPEVVVEVVKQRSKKVYIMGQVKQPGYQEIAADGRLLGTLLNAGGPTSFNTEARVLRLPKGGETTGMEAMETLTPIVVDLQKLFGEGDQAQNVLLRDGDVLMVAEKSPTGMPGEKSAMGPNQFYVVGSVMNPGVYNYQANDTVLDAILRAGGFSEFASRNSTKVVREANGKTQTFQIKMKDVMERGDMEKNISILPGDMIIVPESFF